MLYTNRVWQRIILQADLFPEKVVLCDTKNKSITYRDFVESVNQQAQHLRKKGVKKGERVLFLQRPSVEGIVSFFALYRLGAVVVISDPAMGRENFKSRILYSQAEHVLLDPLLNIIRHIPFCTWIIRSRGYEIPDLGTFLPNIIVPTNIKKVAQVSNEDEEEIEEQDALIIFTSGTTSEPKGVVHSFDSISQMLKLITSEIEASSDDVFYSSQMHFIFLALLLGSQAIIETKSVFSPAQYVRNIAEYKITKTFLLPKEGEDLVRYLQVERKELPKTLNTIMFGSAPVLKGFLIRLREVVSSGIEVLCVYGSTEILPIAITSDKEKINYAGPGDYLGHPIDQIKLDIIDEEIIVSGSHMATRYLHMNSSLVHLHTGDLGSITGEGALVLLGRSKDMIIKGNHNIYPTLFESVISEIPGVGACALVGVYKKETSDEEIILCIENCSNMEDKKFAAAVKTQLSIGSYSIDTYALPDKIICMELPVSGRSRKIDKEKTREIVQLLV